MLSSYLLPSLALLTLFSSSITMGVPTSIHSNGNVHVHTQIDNNLQARKLPYCENEGNGRVTVNIKPGAAIEAMDARWGGTESRQFWSAGALDVEKTVVFKLFKEDGDGTYTRPLATVSSMIDCIQCVYTQRNTPSETNPFDCTIGSLSCDMRL